MKLTRRTVVATAPASPLLRAADHLSARIKVNTENARGPIGKAAQYRFPPHSFTQLEARLA